MLRRRTLRSLRWDVLLATATWLVRQGRDAHGRLSEAERRELADLVKRSRGLPMRLSEKERKRLTALVRVAVAR